MKRFIGSAVTGLAVAGLLTWASAKGGSSHGTMFAGFLFVALFVFAVMYVILARRARGRREPARPQRPKRPRRGTFGEPVNSRKASRHHARAGARR